MCFDFQSLEVLTGYSRDSENLFGITITLCLGVVFTNILRIMKNFMGKYAFIPIIPFCNFCLFFTLNDDK